MRLVAWNLQQRTAGWGWLDRSACDVMLLNEVHPADGRSGVWPPEPVHKARGWRSALVTTLSCEPLVKATPTYRGTAKGTWRVFDKSLTKPGAVAAGIVTLPSRERLVAVAAYGVLSEFADTSMHRIICDLADVLDDPSTPELVVIGGDFNVTTQWAGRDSQYRSRDATVLDRLASLGMVDAVSRFLPHERGPLVGCRCSDEACRHVRTRRDNKHPDEPWQNDYIFVSPAMSERLTSATVVATEETFEMSDHAPIIVEFE